MELKYSRERKLRLCMSGLVIGGFVKSLLRKGRARYVSPELKVISKKSGTLLYRVKLFLLP